MEIKVNNDNFEAEVLNSDKPVLVDFFATWCGPCKMMAPIIEEIANEREDSLKVCTLDIDQAIQIAQKYRVAVVPTFMLFKNGVGKVVTQGYLKKSDFEDSLDFVLNRFE